MTGAAVLRWKDDYRHEGPSLRVHGRKNTSTHEFRQFVQSLVRNVPRCQPTIIRYREDLSRDELPYILETKQVSVCSY